MEIKINLDQLFSGNEDFSNSEYQSCYPSAKESPTIHGSLDSSFDYTYNFNSKIFDTSEPYCEHKIQDIKEDCEDERSMRSTKTVRTINSVKFKTPGERLYYESQVKQIRKNTEKQKANEESLSQMQKIMTFTPEINENSKKIVKKIKNNPPRVQKSMKQQKPTPIIKEEQQLKQCTFKPKIITKTAKVKSKQQFFYYLHNTSKFKEAELNQMIENEYAKFRKLNKKSSEVDFENFLKRNQEYISIIKKKQQMIKQNSAKYDLKTGQKLFSPKVNQSKAFNFHAVSSAKDLKKDAFAKTIDKTQKKNQPIKFQQEANSLFQNRSSGKPKSGIFSKKSFEGNVCSESQAVKQSYQLKNREQIKQLPEDNSQELQRQYQIYLQQFQQELQTNQRNEKAILQESIEHSHQSKTGKNKDRVSEYCEEREVHNFNQQEFDDRSISDINDVKPFNIENVNNFLNSSEENQNDGECRKNDVMDILNHLLIKQEDDV